jgi:uncharacterized metal-binding protein
MVSLKSVPDFALEVSGVEGLCPAGEAYAQKNMSEGKIPVISCEACCIRGEIARLSANMVAVEEPFARCCHAETFTVPNSSMARWVRESEKVVMIDGCFLVCHGRILKNIIDAEKICHFDTLKLHGKYSDIFETEMVPESERKEVARQVADKILAQLKDDIRPAEIVA